MTTGDGFRSGGRRFLQDANARLNGRQLTVRGHNSFTLGHKVSAHNKQAILQDQIGLANNPVVAEYSIGIITEHYAPVGRYFISVRPGKNKSVHILTTDHHDLFRSLSDPWILGELGVYYIGY